MATINGTNGTDTLEGTLGNDTINGLDGVDVLYGDAGTDILNGGNGNDFLEGGTGNDTLNGGADFDFATYVVATSAVSVNLSITAAQNTGGAGSDTLTSIEGLIGSAFNDTLTGNGGDNILDGGAGKDTFHGAAGNDLLQISTTSDYVSGETFDGGANYDVLFFTAGDYNLSGSTLTSIEELGGVNVTISLTPGQLNGMDKVAVNSVTLTTGGTADLTGAQIDTTTFQLQAAATLNLTNSTGVAHIIRGSSGADHITGGNAGDTLYGNAGNDVVTGGSGNDLIYGDDDSGPGNDTLSGGGGNDEIHGGSGTSTPNLPGNDVINGDDGNDTLYADTGGTMQLNGGNDNDLLIGNDEHTGMNGGAGDDTLQVNRPLGAPAGLVLDGGTGTDTLHIDNPGFGFTVDFTTITVQGIETFDAAGVDMRLGVAQLNSFAHFAARSVSVAGSGKAVLGGMTSGTSFTIESSGVNLDFTGSSGSAAVHGSSNADIVTGTLSNDGLDGNDGNDTLRGDEGSDTINGGIGNDTLSGGNGIDSIDGNEGNDSIKGDGDDDYLHGLDGNDTLDGGTGTDFLGGGEGSDTASYASSAAAVTVTLATSNQQDTIGAGLDTLDSIENLTGSNSGDTLTGNGGDNVINGLGGSDTIDLTAGGTDTGIGGTGNDQFLLAGQFTATEKIDGGDGNDTVRLDGDYAAGVVFTATTVTNVEAIALTAGHAYKLTTNNGTLAAGQTMTVNGITLGASDTLIFDGAREADGALIVKGGAGNDVFKGGLGAVTFLGANGDDSFSFASGFSAIDVVNGGSGSNALALNGDYSAGVVFQATTIAGIQLITLAKDHDYNLTTNNANVAAGKSLQVDASTLGAANHVAFNGSAETDGLFKLRGGAGDDTLTGGGGNDNIRGGFGADHLQGGGGVDTYAYLSTVESTGAHYDTIDLDFTEDKLDVATKPKTIDATINNQPLSTATFDSDLASILTGTSFGKGHAIVVTAGGGDLAGINFLVIDENGVAGYQSGGDLVIAIGGSAGVINLNLDTGDFI